ncbi:ribosomal large subunit export from nucleus [Spatholobus suberectus]|nr:ribosomal large subunit export from nucleus [Spatholobus suberectus]
MGDVLAESKDGILSNEDFQRIKELKAKREAKNALAQQGLAKSAAIKVPSSDQLSLKRVDGTMLEVHVRKKLSKDERLALVRAGREERGKYHARTAVKQNKTGGLSNRQKEHKKKMPLAAKRDKVARTRIEKKKKHQRSGKQFRGRKAWKQ